MPSLYCSLGIPALFSVIFLAVGVFSPAWMVFSMRIDTQKLEASSDSNVDPFKQQLGLFEQNGTDVELDIWMGLWTIIGCLRSDGIDLCAAVSTAALQNGLSSKNATSEAGIKELTDAWLVLQILAVCSLFCVGFGLICIFVMGKATEDRKCSRGSVTATCWFLTAIFILAAVGKQTIYYVLYDLGSLFMNQLDTGVLLKLHTPWAIIVSGIGGALAAAVAVITLLFLFFGNKQTSGKFNARYTLLENKSGQLV